MVTKNESTGVEIRHFPDLQLRAVDEERKLFGYAAPFNSLSVDFGRFKEVIAPGAFTRTLRERPDVRALVDHDTGKVIGRVGSNSLLLREDDAGLHTEITPIDNTLGNDILASVRRGDIDGMSIGFRVVSDKWEMRDGKELRTLLDVDLLEVSIVAFPAYPETSISARSALAAWEEHQRTTGQPGRSHAILKRRVALLELFR